jgi:hypothetical protein
VTPLSELANWTADGTLLEKIAYDERDAVGNVKQATTTRADGTTEVARFVYDALHRLEDAVYTVDGAEQEHQHFSDDGVGVMPL